MGPTACVTKRRSRDRWNTAVVKRSAQTHKRAMNVKAVLIAKGTQNQFVRQSAAAEIRRAVRAQATTTLRLAGQWLGDAPVRGTPRPHCMRMMLVANMDVGHGFANGTLGRGTHWGPEALAPTRRANARSVLSNVPDVQVRFYKETSFHNDKTYFFPRWTSWTLGRAARR